MLEDHQSLYELQRMILSRALKGLNELKKEKDSSWSPSFSTLSSQICRQFPEYRVQEIFRLTDRQKDRLND